MERMGSRRTGHESGNGNTVGGRVGALRAAAVTVAVAAALAGCSVTVQPKKAAASQPLSPTPSATSAATPSADASSSASATPSTSPSAGKDVDHAACTAVREDLLNTQQKVQADKNSPKRMGQDYKNAAYNLRTQAGKTKSTELKTTLDAVAAAYVTLGTDVTNHDPTDADLKKVEEVSQPLATLCGAKS